MNQRATTILRIDGSGALTAGLTVLLLRDWLSGLYAFPVAWVVFIGVANVAYGSYASGLAVRTARGKTPSRRAVDALVAANLVWVVTCAVMLVERWRSATVYGLAHVAAEGLFVAGLAVAEYRFVRPCARVLSPRA